MKKLLCILLAGIFCALAASLFASAATTDIRFDDDDAVTALTGGYPRLSRLNDGTLLAICGDVVRSSRDGGKTWVRHNLFNGLASTYTASTGTVHTLSRENWQGYVLPNGQLMTLYRARTKGPIESDQEFYTSIRARIFTSTPDEYMNGAKSLTYTDEVVVVEALATGLHGFWEPIALQIAPDTLAIYYADDYTVSKPSSQQNIAYKLYTISTNTWSEDAYVAIDGASRSSRDGMPGVTTLADGTFAMVMEAFDYNWRSYNGTYGKSVFVISMSRSVDGRTWSAPVPIAAPQSITAGRRCAAPYMATLPDGRIAVSYMTDDLYIGTFGDLDHSRYCNSMLIVSNAPVTNTSTITATTGGVSSSFTSLGTPVTPVANGNQIWTSVSAFEGDLYFATGCATNDGSIPSSVQIRHAEVDIAMPIIAADNQNADGSIVVSLTKTSAFDGYKYYRAEEGGDFVLLADTTATSYTDKDLTPGRTYTYKVTGYRGGDERTSAERSVSALPPMPTVTVSYDGSAVKLDWTASAGATRYVVRRKIVGESSWTFNKAINISQTSYTDTDVTAETKYIYKLEADTVVGNAHNVNASEKNVWTVRPTLTLSDATTGSIKLTWSASTSAEGYRIYRKVLGDSSYTVIADVSADTLTYTDADLAPYTSYAYVLRATYTDGSTLRISFDVGGKILKTLCAHVWDDGTVTTAPTCTAGGEKKFTCTVCGESTTEPLGALGHDFAEEYTVDTPATCTAEGEKSQHCSRCDARQNITPIPMIAHTYGDGVVVTAAGCTEDGELQFTCTVCGDVKTDVIEKLGHDFAEEYTVDTPATCTAEGEKSQHCSRCDARQNITPIPMTAHTYGDGVVTVAPEVGKRGVRTYTCSICGHVEESEILALDEVSLVVTEEMSGDAFDEISARAGTKEFKMITLAADEENGGSEGTVTLPGTTAYVYRKNGVYLTPVDIANTESGVSFVGDAGDTIVYSTEPLVLFGDANADNRLTLSDVLRGFRYLAGQAEGIDYAASDMSGDCNIGLLDFLLTLRQILNG
ncbi:MAG: hypothetical protein IJU41_05155 [Clostridia bacterium]|nr:hypothetical protein [Clostridia bacterium]